MKKTSSARRVPRKVGQDEDDDDDTSNSSDTSVRRPANKPRKSSSLRTSLGPSSIEDEESEASVVTKRSNLSRVAIQRNASKRSALNPSSLPTRSVEDEDERPSYSAASLRELKESTPTIPQEFSSATSSDLETTKQNPHALDVSSKFGSSLARYGVSSAIPSAAEIAEKKARRARLAKEQQAEEFISLDPDDPQLDDDDDDNVMKDENGRLVLKPKDKYGLSESRLVREDEDIMENFDEFTEDGGIALGRKAEAEAARRRKQEMAAQIAEAEGASDSDSDESEHERNVAFEAAQTRHGTYSQNVTVKDPADARPKTPPTITPLPTLDGVIERLRNQVAEMQTSRMRKLQEMESLQREKIRLAEEEVRIQRALKETAEKFEQLRDDRGVGGNGVHSASTALGGDTPAIEAPRPLAAPGPNGDHNSEGEDDEDEADRPGFSGLGFGTSRRGLGGGPN